MFQYKLYEKWYNTNNNSDTINKSKNLKTKQKPKTTPIILSRLTKAKFIIIIKKPDLINLEHILKTSQALNIAKTISVVTSFINETKMLTFHEICILKILNGSTAGKCNRMYKVKGFKVKTYSEIQP